MWKYERTHPYTQSAKNTLSNESLWLTLAKSQNKLMKIREWLLCHRMTRVTVSSRFGETLEKNKKQKQSSTCLRNQIFDIYRGNQRPETNPTGSSRGPCCTAGPLRTSSTLRVWNSRLFMWGVLNCSYHHPRVMGLCHMLDSFLMKSLPVSCIFDLLVLAWSV